MIDRLARLGQLLVAMANALAVRGLERLVSALSKKVLLTACRSLPQVTRCPCGELMHLVAPGIPCDLGR
jgi:hypothetical protein